MCIAQAPIRPRDSGRLLVLPRRGAAAHHRFLDLPDLLDPGDLLVVNSTRVIPARLRLTTTKGGRVELVLCHPVDAGVTGAHVWDALGRPGRALRPGRRLITPGGDELEVIERRGELWRVRGGVPLWQVIEAVGEVPLPPYIERPSGPCASDREDYQTIFARQPGAVAAPTASLHFTDRVLADLQRRHIERASLVLHVGPGTFVPVREQHAADVRGHVMHAEHYTIPKSTIDAIEATRARGGRVVAIGTTVVRALESWQHEGQAAGEATLFIYPGFTFDVVDAMLTNFHLPRSTLLMLVAAFAGRERILYAYATAVRQKYRFFSYGDAMLLL